MLQLVTGFDLDHNSLKLREGYTGDEPKDIRARGKRHRDLIRTAIAINTFYPELEGGYYINRELIELVQQSLNSIGFQIVLKEVYRANGLVPIEINGGLVVDEEYYLVDSAGVQGFLLLWEFTVGGGGEFYKDSLVMDFHIPKEGVEAFKKLLEKETDKLGIPLIIE